MFSHLSAVSGRFLSAQLKLGEERLFAFYLVEIYIAQTAIESGVNLYVLTCV